MKFSTIASSLMLAGMSTALPAVEKRQNIDVTVLQFALTLEHLENVFYKQALTKFSAHDFAKAGFGAKYYNDLKYIAEDEEQHVLLLTSALKTAGAAPVAACEYNFPYTDIASFLTLSSVLEGVGTSAYLGGAPLISSKDYLTVAGSILVTEALHTSLQRSARGLVPAANSYGTPLSPNPVFTLAASFIKSCPSSNAPLPFKAFPALTAGAGQAAAGGKKYTFQAMGLPSSYFVTFVSGLTTVSVKPEPTTGGNFNVVIPTSVEGQSYVFVTKSAVNTTLADSEILFGPAIVEVAQLPPTYNNAILK